MTWPEAGAPLGLATGYVSFFGLACLLSLVWKQNVKNVPLKKDFARTIPLEVVDVYIDSSLVTPACTVY